MSVAAQAYPMPDETPRIVIRAEDHFGLAIEVAKKYARRRRGQMLMDTDEFSDALLGLTIAIQTFDQERKIEFSTWAHICMSRQIIHHGRSRKRAERLPTESIERMSRRDVVEIPDYRGGNHTLPTWLIEKFFAPHPEDSEKDARCKQIVYDYYMKDMTLEEIPRIEPPPPPSSMLTILADDAKEIALRTGVKRVREKMSDLLGGFLRSKGMEESAITTLLTSDYGQGIVSYLVGFSYELVKEDGGDSKIQEFVGSVLGELRIQAGVLIADEVINDLLNPVVSTLRTEIPMGAEKVRVIETPMGDSVEEETLVLPPQSSLTS